MPQPAPDAPLEFVTSVYLCDCGQGVVGSPDPVIRHLRRRYPEAGGFGTLLLPAGRDPAPRPARLAMFERFARAVASTLAPLGRVH